MSEKVIGYILLSGGLLVIVFCGVNVYLVFSGQIPPVQLFSGPGISFDPTSLFGGAASGFVAKPQELVPAETLNKTSNIFAHIFLMGFLASIGYKLAALGVQLVRPIVVKIKEKNASEYEVKSEMKA